MIISKLNGRNNKAFEELLDDTGGRLEYLANKNPNSFSNLLPIKLEEKVYEKMKESSRNSIFEGTIELKSGHSFPDIISNKYPYGVEVKSKKTNSWRTTGNSVLESTRIENIERIYFFYAKLFQPIEFKHRLYQDCIYDVTVTHSPRYKIDMELPTNQSFFKKINIDYDRLRRLENPITPIVDYFKKNANPGEYTWWMGDEPISEFTKPTVTLFSNLSSDEKRYFMSYAYARFPEIVSSSRNKFERFASWLAGYQGIVSSNLRDNFTAGGRTDIIIKSMTFQDVPRVFSNLFSLIPSVKQIISELSKEEIIDGWNLRSVPKNINREVKWKEIIINNAESNFTEVDNFLNTIF